MADYIRVTALNALAKQWLAQCDPLNNLIVLGEISNFTRHYKADISTLLLRTRQLQ